MSDPKKAKSETKAEPVRKVFHPLKKEDADKYPEIANANVADLARLEREALAIRSATNAEKQGPVDAETYTKQTTRLDLIKQHREYLRANTPSWTDWAIHGTKTSQKVRDHLPLAVASAGALALGGAFYLNHLRNQRDRRRHLQMVAGGYVVPPEYGPSDYGPSPFHHPSVQFHPPAAHLREGLEQSVRKITRNVGAGLGGFAQGAAKTASGAFRPYQPTKPLSDLTTSDIEQAAARVGAAAISRIGLAAKGSLEQAVDETVNGFIRRVLRGSDKKLMEVASEYLQMAAGLGREPLRAAMTVVELVRSGTLGRRPRAAIRVLRRSMRLLEQQYAAKIAHEQALEKAKEAASPPAKAEAS